MMNGLRGGEFMRVDVRLICTGEALHLLWLGWSRSILRIRLTEVSGVSCTFHPKLD